MLTDKQGNPTTARKRLIKAVEDIPQIPEYSIMMHVKNIEEGAYSLLDLIDTAKYFYTEKQFIGNNDSLPDHPWSC